MAADISRRTKTLITGIALTLTLGLSGCSVNLDAETVDPAAAAAEAIQNAPEKQSDSKSEKTKKKTDKGEKSKKQKAEKSKKKSDKKAKAKAKTGTALATLKTLDVKGRAPKTGYARENFGSAWKDVDGNGCDTRNDILARDLDKKVVDADGCTILTGVLVDPFSGKTINFTRGQSTSLAVQIDHSVPLSLAWQTGAQGLSQKAREAFANDPLNLIAVDGPLNAQKSDGDAATWLPPQKTYRCAYVARQIAVRAKYDLWVTSPEKDAMNRVLSSCPDQNLPKDKGLKVSKGDVKKDYSNAKKAEKKSPSKAKAEKKTSTSKKKTATKQKTDPQFSSCTKLHEAGKGYGPYYKGQDPEYHWYIDRDKDGVVCEK